MKVLVTGHRGYVGAVVVPMLLEAGHDVSGYDLDYFGQCTYSHGGPYRAVPTIQKDIRDALPEDFEGFEAVVHLAGLPDASSDELAPELIYEVNHKASVRVALAAQQAGVSRLLLASSCAVYGNGGEDLLDESASLDAHSAFGVSKVMAERDVSALASQNFSPTFLRLAEPCGLSPRLRLDLLFNSLVAMGATEGTIPVSADGMAWRPFVHLQDIARVVVAMLGGQRLAFHNQALNVGATTGNVREKDLAAIIAELVPESRRELGAPARVAGQSCRVSFEKLAHLLPAVVPQWTPLRSVQQLYDAFQASMLATEEVEGPRYDRVAELLALIHSGALDRQLRRRDIRSGGGVTGGEGLRVIQ